MLSDSNKNEITRFNTDELFSRYENYGEAKEGISEKDATFIIENNKVKVKFIIKDVYISKVTISKEANKDIFNASFYILIKFK